MRKLPIADKRRRARYLAGLGNVALIALGYEAGASLGGILETTREGTRGLAEMLVIGRHGKNGPEAIKATGADAYSHRTT